MQESMGNTAMWGWRSSRRYNSEKNVAEVNVGVAEIKMTDYRKLNAGLQLVN